MKQFLGKINNAIIISNSNYKKYFLESNSNQLKNIIYKTYDEVIKDMIGYYDDSARIDLVNQGFSPQLAKIKLDNSLLVDGDNLKTKKLEDLLKLRKENETKLIKNPLVNNLYNKNIYIIDYYVSDDLFNKSINLIKQFNHNVEYIYSKNKINSSLNIYEYNNPKEELNELLINIGGLIKDGIDPNNIKVFIPNTYYNYANQIFSIANIDLNIDFQNYLSEYEITKLIIKDLKLEKRERIEEIFSDIINKYKYKNSIVLDNIIDIFNSYMKYDYTFSEIIEDILYKIDTTTIKNSYIGGIKICNILEEVILDEDYVFILGINQDIFPHVYKDDDYLLDYEKLEININTSKEKNLQLVNKTKDLFKGVKNLYLSYSQITDSGLTPISSIIGKLKEEIEVNLIPRKNNNLISYSEQLDKLKLGKRLDLYYRYGVVNNELLQLYKKYKSDNYSSYDNKFTKIHPLLLESKLSNFNLSYTTIDKYYRCAFLYYLEDVLKIRRFSNEESLFIGQILHHILEKLLKAKEVLDIDLFIDNVINEYICSNNIELKKKQRFFINQYKEVLKSLFIFIKTQEENSDFSIFGLEKEFKIVLCHEDISVNLTGKIDKVLTLKIGEDTYAIVVDYKSGSTDFDLNYVAHGLNMQIMMYFYFLNNYSNSSYKFAGGYLQGIMPSSEFKKDTKKTYSDLLNDHFKLEGYSTSNLRVLEKIDKDIFSSSKYIKGINFKADGNPHENTKNRLIDDNTFEKLLKATDEKIKGAISSIKAGNFTINPKKNNQYDSCTYCQYRDLCFSSDKDYVQIEKYEKFSFLGGNDDTN